LYSHLLNDEGRFLEGLALAIIIVEKMVYYFINLRTRCGLQNSGRIHVWHETESPTVCLTNANILWLGMRPQIDGSNETTAFYFPIAVDQKDRSGRESPGIFPVGMFPELHRRPLSWEKDTSADGRALLVLFLSSIFSFFVSSSISCGPGKL